MLTYYARLIDRLVPPKVEKMFRLGRRHTVDRRIQAEERRNSEAENFRYNLSERRDSQSSRRSPGLDERRRRWFRINLFQSRNYNWSPDTENSESSDLST